MRHIKILTKLGLTQGTTTKKDVLAYCSPDSVDDCSGLDQAHCQGSSTDYCIQDYSDGACMFNSYDDCHYDYKGCAYGSTDYCYPSDFDSCSNGQTDYDCYYNCDQCGFYDYTSG